MIIKDEDMKIIYQRLKKIEEDLKGFDNLVTKEWPEGLNRFQAEMMLTSEMTYIDDILQLLKKNF